MEKTEAYTILRIPIEASRSKVETAFHQRTREVRARFDAARGMSLRAQYQREFAAVCDAQDCLLSELVEKPREQPRIDQPLVDDSQIDEHVDAPHLQEPRHDARQVDEAMVHEARVDDARVDESRIDQADVNEPPVHKPPVHKPPVHDPHVHEPPVHQPHVHEPRAEAPRAREQPITLPGENHTRKSPRPTASISDSAKKPPSMTERRAKLGIRGEDTPTAIVTPPPVKSGTPSSSKLAPSVLPPATRKPWLPIAGVVFILMIVSAVAFLAFHHLTESPSPRATPSPETRPTPSPEVSPTPFPEASPTPSPEASPTPSPEVSATPSSQETGAPNESQPASPSPTPFSQQDIDATKGDVIKRIMALPGISARVKANLVSKMDRARTMERLTIIPFDIGQTVLHRAAAEKLVKTFENPEMRDKLSDPTIILVVAGYADTVGRTDRNLHISQERAERVTRILKVRAKLLNAMQTIGMGGTELLDSRRSDHNRAVEVWAIVPL